MQAEVTKLSSELGKAKQTVITLAEDLKRKEISNPPPSRHLAKESSSQIPEMKAGLLVRKYVELYAQTRLETMEALDNLPELDGLDDLKSKLLFSVIVVSHFKQIFV